MKFSSISTYLYDAFFIYFQCIFKFFPLMEIPLIFGLCHYLWCRRGNNHFDVHFRRIGPVHFLSKDGKDGKMERWKGREMKVQLLLYKLLPSRTVQLLTFDCLYGEDFPLILKRGV